MSRIVEVGPYDSIDPRNWGEHYSERRSLDRIEWELEHYYDFRFSFKDHLIDQIRLLGDTTHLRALEGGCGEGVALYQLTELGRKLGVQVETTGITKDPRHKDILVGYEIDEVVIGTVQNFFRVDSRSDYYHFIFDYTGALANDYSGFVQGGAVIPLYRRVIAPRGTALLASPPITEGLLEKNMFRVLRGSSDCVLVTGETERRIK